MSLLLIGDDSSKLFKVTYLMNFYSLCDEVELGSVANLNLSTLHLRLVDYIYYFSSCFLVSKKEDFDIKGYFDKFLE